MDRKFLNIRKIYQKNWKFPIHEWSSYRGKNRDGDKIFFIIQERDVTCMKYFIFSLIVLSLVILSRNGSLSDFQYFSDLELKFSDPRVKIRSTRRALTKWKFRSWWKLFIFLKGLGNIFRLKKNRGQSDPGARRTSLLKNKWRISDRFFKNQYY